MHTVLLRDKAIALREAGYSYLYIAQEIGVSKSTLSGWLAHVPYSPNAETVRLMGKARAAAATQKARARQYEDEALKTSTRKDLGELSERDILMFGLGLYVGEGTKTNDIVRLSNANPDVICAAMAWFKVLGVSKQQFSARLFLYPDSDEETSITFWMRRTGLTRSQFLRSYIDRRTNKKRASGKLPHGTLHLGVRAGGRKEFGVQFSRRILALTEAAIQNIQKRD